MSPIAPPDPITLFCLPCAGASATMYFRWRRLLPTVRIVPVELPGRGARFQEPLVENFDSLVAQLTDEIASVLPRRYAFFGHSMGGLLGYALMRQLHEKGMQLPLFLCASACAAPSRRDKERYAEKRDRASLIADLHEQGGTPPEIFDNQEILDITLRLLGADYRVCESFNYVEKHALPVPVHVFAGKNDTIEPERQEAWKNETTRAFSLEWFEGGHFFIRNHEPEILSRLTHFANRANVTDLPEFLITTK